MWNMIWVVVMVQIVDNLGKHHRYIGKKKKYFYYSAPSKIVSLLPHVLAEQQKKGQLKWAKHDVLFV